MFATSVSVNSATFTIDTTLNVFIRSYANILGTKFMCIQGGCGACIVNIKGVHPVTKDVFTWSVNSVCNIFLFLKLFTN